MPCAILSTHDGLTGLVNATFFHAILSREIDRSLRTGRTCGLMVIDIDHFKQINDTYGHSTGDKVLQAVAEQMKLSLRSMDTAARIGGEEFAIILPECTPEDAIRAATRIHSALNPLMLQLEQNTLQLTTSGGLVWTNPNMPVSSAALLSEADQEMYRAKWAGRAAFCYRHPDFDMVSRQERSALMRSAARGRHQWALKLKEHTALPLSAGKGVSAKPLLPPILRPPCPAAAAGCSSWTPIWVWPISISCWMSSPSSQYWTHSTAFSRWRRFCSTRKRDSIFCPQDRACPREQCSRNSCRKAFAVDSQLR